MFDICSLVNGSSSPDVMSCPSDIGVSVFNEINNNAQVTRAREKIGNNGEGVKRSRRTAQQMEELKIKIAEDHNAGVPFAAVMHKYNLRKDFLIKIYFSLQMEGQLCEVSQKYEVINTPQELKKVMNKFGIANSEYLRVEPDVQNGKIIVMEYK